MSFTTIPSSKGQITIPIEMRKKYQIDQHTPLRVHDEGNGVISIKVLKTVDYDAVEYYENDESFGLKFKNGIDPQLLIDEINKIDG